MQEMIQRAPAPSSTLAHRSDKRRFRGGIARWSRYAAAALLLHALLLAVLYFAWLRLDRPAPPPIVVATLLSPLDRPLPAQAATLPPATPGAHAHRPVAPRSNAGARALRAPEMTRSEANAAESPVPNTGTDSAPHAPAEPAPTAAAPDAQNARAAQASARWEAEVIAQLDRVKGYPAAALLRGQQDVVSVRIRAARSGAVLFAQIADSRGYAALDGEALALIERANPLPKPPPQLREQDLEFVVPINFQIEQTRVGNWW